MPEEPKRPAEIRFDSVVPKEIPVTLGSERYVLRQGSGLVLDRYKAKLAECSQIVDGKVNITDPAKAVDAGKLLVSLCLSDSEGKAVPLETIQGWLGEIGDALVDAVIGLHPSLTGGVKDADAKNS